MCTGPEELQGYLEALMAKLLEVVRSGNPETQETALGAIASAANAAGASFQPYVAAVFPVLRQYMEVTPTLADKILTMTIITTMALKFGGDTQFGKCIVNGGDSQSYILSCFMCTNPPLHETQHSI